MSFTIGVLTSGGDAPGMNAAIRAVVRAGLTHGWRVLGVLRGYAGLMNGETREMTSSSVSEIIGRGGTILYTARSEEMMTVGGQARAASICREKEMDALVVIGGDGSFSGAQALANLGINVIGIPGTIDLDIPCTDYSIGFDTAVNTAMEAVDKIRDTSSSHERCSIVEVMGRSAGYIALHCGISTGAEDILLPELYNGDEKAVFERVIKNRKAGKKHHIIINAEGVGHSEEMAERIEAATGVETRATILGYLQRGGSPTCRDRLLATQMGVRAVSLLAAGARNRIIALKHDEVVDYDINEALAMKKVVPQELLEILPLLKR